MATERFPSGLRMYQNYDQERWGRINFSKLRACPQARAPHPNAGVADPRGGCVCVWGRGGWMRPEGGTNRILIYRGGPEVAALPQSQPLRLLSPCRVASEQLRKFSVL